MVSATGSSFIAAPAEKCSSSSPGSSPCQSQSAAASGAGAGAGGARWGRWGRWGRWLLFFSVAVLALCLTAPQCHAQPTGDKQQNLIDELDMMDDDGSVETALINYLFAKQLVNRMRKEMDVSDLKRKRTYWKQCAFNAVSCFGK